MKERSTFVATIATFYSMLNAFGYSFTKLTKWASGTWNVPYVDNRMLLSFPMARKWLRKALKSLISQHEINFVDFFFGIPKAGIGPATLLSLETGKSLLLEHEDKYYSIKSSDIESYIEKIKEEIDLSIPNLVIAGTVPFGIPFGIAIAEKFNLPFLFVREKPKDHGKMKQVEGIINKGSRVILIDPAVNDFNSYNLNAIDGLTEAGLLIETTISEPAIVKIVDSLEKAYVAGVEDLTSTGESSLEKVLKLRVLGATINNIYCTFSYELPSAVKNFKDNNCGLKSVIVFRELIDTYGYLGLISDEDVNQLLLWYQNQPDYGDTHGYPSDKMIEEEKKKSESL